MKKCKACLERKAESDFHNRRSVCKACRREHERSRWQTDEYKEGRRSRQALTRKTAAYRKKERVRQRVIRDSGRYRVQRHARAALQRAVMAGRLKRPDKCSCCLLASNRIHGHHEDYSKPLDVVWLCPQCHSDVHRARYPAEEVESE